MEQRSPLLIFRSVVFALLLREILTRFGSRRMGAFWVLFEPISHVLVLVLILSVVRGKTIVGLDYPVFLLMGLIPFFLMRNISLKMMDSVSANKSLFAYPNVKPFDTYVARMLLESILAFLVFLILMVGMAWFFNFDIGIAKPLQWMLAMLTGIVLSFGLGLILSVVAELAPNTKTFIRVFFMPVYLASGIIFPIWIVPERYMHYLLWNPYLHIVDNLRYTAFHHYPRINGVEFLYPFEIALVLVFVGMVFYRVKRRAILAL